MWPPIINIMDNAARKAARGLIHDFGEIEQLQSSKNEPIDFATKAFLNTKSTLKTELEKALPDLPEDIAIDVAPEPLKMARQARSGLMENAFLRKKWKACISEAEHGRSIIPDYLLYQPHREGYPIEFVAKGMQNEDMEMVTKGVEMQEEFLQYVIEVGYLKPWEEAYFVSYAISVISRNLLK